MSKASPKPMHSGEVIDALAARFAPPAYAFLPQVRDSTGTGSAGTADALAMSLWPSRGIELHGIEVKVYRNDWLRELKKPAKGENIGQFCHRWWVAAAIDVVKVEELPPLWGLLVQRGKGLARVVEAPYRIPKDIDRFFLAAILRRAAQDCPYARRKTREYEDGVERGKEENQRELFHHKTTHERLAERLREFEEASGLKIRDWSDTKKMGEAVRILTNGSRWSHGPSVLDRVEDVATHVERQAVAARKIAEEIKAATQEDTPAP